MKYFVEADKQMEIKERNSLDFPAHLHEQFEIGYIEEGSAVLILDEKKYSLEKGNFFVVFPNQIHSYERSENIKSKLIIFPPHLIGEYENLYSSKIPQNPVIQSSNNGKKVIAVMFDTMTDNINVLKGFLLSLFGILTSGIRLNDIDKYNVSTLKSLLMYCSEHFNEGITVLDVSDKLHLSRYYIAHIFREKLNTTFSDYMTKHRIDYACTLLRDKNLTSAEVAYQSGFNSIRSFNRNFLKHMEMSPKDYRKAIFLKG